jgi:MFS family permease
MFMVGVAISSVAIYLALYFKEINFNHTGRFFGLATIGILISRVFAGQIQDRFGHRMVICPAIVFMTTAIALIPHARSIWLLFVTSLCWGLSTGTIFPSLQALTFSNVSPHQKTSAAASLFNSFDIGIGFGSIFLGYICERFGTYRVAFIGSLINCLAFLCFYLFYYFILHPPKAKPKTKVPQRQSLDNPLPKANLLQKETKNPV